MQLLFRFKWITLTQSLLSGMLLRLHLVQPNHLLLVLRNKADQCQEIKKRMVGALAARTLISNLLGKAYLTIISHLHLLGREVHQKEC